MNLNHFVASLADTRSDYYIPEARILLITPPPFVLSMHVNASGGPANLELEHTRKYKNGCKAVGKVWKERTSGRVQTLDSWAALVDAAGGESDDSLRPSYAYDGVHLTTKGYRVIYDDFTRIVQSDWPHLDPSKIKMPVPRWISRTGSWEWYNPHSGPPRRFEAVSGLASMVLLPTIGEFVVTTTDTFTSLLQNAT